MVDGNSKIKNKKLRKASLSYKRSSHTERGYDSDAVAHPKKLAGRKLQTFRLKDPVVQSNKPRTYSSLDQTTRDEKLVQKKMEAIRDLS